MSGSFSLKIGTIPLNNVMWLEGQPEHPPNRRMVMIPSSTSTNSQPPACKASWGLISFSIISLTCSIKSHPKFTRYPQACGACFVYFFSNLMFFKTMSISIKTPVIYQTFLNVPALDHRPYSQGVLRLFTRQTKHSVAQIAVK